ncbi:MAG TPA: NADH-ubiquinone oxidoreductase-F iron-sulfur binding region domain-containing protein [Solirubrobacteraceae bacterium]|nr:NADH-ubiquinone oxidoreductase-F iron-sulfur binding region domain-containing protein [Solirubrobacteraceae bacterium]
MSTISAKSTRRPTKPAPPAGLPRLLDALDGGEPVGLRRHIEVHGPLPPHRDGRGLADLVEAAGLRGRGGASFPTATKLRAVRKARGRAIVVANGCESEPLSIKDALLLRELPHLVLDGAAIAAAAVGADEVIVAFEAPNTQARDSLEQALEERRAAGVDSVDFSLFAAAERFLSGQETALISQLGGGPAKPTFVPPRPTERGLRRRPTLVQNVETLANLALIARHGAHWYRELGSEAETGTRLVTVAGAVESPGVFEIECGTPLPSLLAAAGGIERPLVGVLIGGYFGSWLPAARLDEIELSNEALARHGATLGCGVVVALPADACPVAETTRIAIYLATETAKQCGPCVHGTAAIARTLHGVAEGTPPPSAFADLDRWITELPGRGACHHPNGLARFVATSLRTFAGQFRDHAANGPCDACSAEAVLEFPQAQMLAAAA